jgi:hypothetical protein
MLHFPAKFDILSSDDLPLLLSSLSRKYLDRSLASFSESLVHEDQIPFVKLLPRLAAAGTLQDTPLSCSLIPVIDGPNLSSFEVAVQGLPEIELFCACIYSSY